MKKEKRNNNPYFISVILPIILSILVGLLLIVLLIIEPCFKLCLTTFDSANIVISLLPAVVTIISISLQIHDDSVYNVRIRDYQSIRVHMHFSLLNMVLISIFGFVFELLTNLLNRPLTGIILAGVAGVYSIWFAVSELPILMKNEKTIKRLLKGFWLKNAQNLQIENEVFDEAIKNFISTRGIKEAFESLHSKKISDDELLFFLLSRQNEYLRTCLENTTYYKDNQYLGFGGIDVIEILPNIYKNISDLTDLNEKFNYTIYDEDGQNIYELTNLCFLADGLSRALSIPEEKSIDRFKRILLHYHWRKDANLESPFFNNFILTMIFWNLTKGDCWFYKAFRDNDYPPFHYDIKKEPLIYFSAILACYVFNSSHISDQTKNNIGLFMDEPTLGLNSNGYSLRQNIANSIDSIADAKDFFDGLDVLLNIGIGLKEHKFDIYPLRKGVFLVDDSTDFNVYLLAKYWLEILLFHEYVICTEDEFYDYLVSLTDRKKEIIVRVIENRLLIDANEINPSIQTPFFDFVYSGQLRKSRGLNQPIAQALIEFKNKYNLDQYEKTHKTIDDKLLLSIKSKEDELIGECISLFKTNWVVDDKFSKEYIRVLRLEGESDELIPLLEAYLKGMKSSINFVISDVVLSKIVATPVKDYKYTTDQVNEIVMFKPDLVNSVWGFQYSCNEEQLKKWDTFKVKNVEYLPRNSFAKNDGVIFNVKYNCLASMPRKATDYEINEIIDKEYIPTNGLYTFSKYKGANAGSFLITREDLFKRIKDRIVIVPIVIKIAVDVKEDKIKVFKYEN